MSDEATMRLRLQNVAAYRELRRSVQKGGRENVVFALFMLAAAYFIHNGGVPVFAVILYACLGIGEMLIGLFKWAFPSAECLILDAFVLLTFAALNFGREFLLFQQGQPISTSGLFFGFLMLYFAVGRFKNYNELRKLFAERPSPEHIAWFDDLVHEIQSSDPHTDPLALDLPTRPRWKAKLLGGTVFFVAASGNTVWIAGADEFSLRRAKVDPGTGRRKAMLNIHGVAYPEFELDDVSWANYTKWMAAQVEGDRGA